MTNCYDRSNLSQLNQRGINEESTRPGLVDVSLKLIYSSAISPIDLEIVICYHGIIVEAGSGFSRVK